jgi:hypothetical protein
MKKTISILTILVVLFLASCTTNNNLSKKSELSVEELDKQYQKALFAGGCFWCSESNFEKLDGVIEVISGYSGGERENPTYKEVSAGETSHRESVLIYYDSSII